MAALLITFLFLVPFFIQLTHASPRIDIVSRNCVEHEATNVSAFVMNYWKAMKEVQLKLERNKFGIASAGEPLEPIYVMAQCYNDLSDAECLACFTECRNLVGGCFPCAGARVYLDGCFIRAADYNFFHETVTPEDKLICGSNYNDSMDVELARLGFNNVIKKAIGNDGYGYDSEVNSKVSVYTQAICWKTLEEKACTFCLTSAVSTILSCFPATEGRALKAGCLVQYSDYEFINTPRSKFITKKTLLFITYILCGTAVSIFAISIGVLVGKVIYEQQNKKQNKLKGTDPHGSLFKRSLRFKYSTLEKATGHFSESNKLGQGAFGVVYKGCLADGREIAIKRLFTSSSNGSQEIYNEMNIISRAQHKNLVRFLGCSLTSHDNLLVYEFLANKSLNQILFDPEKKKELDWKKRHRIIIGTAEGLEYLHKDCEVVIIHRDIKASNVLLDLRYRPKIADFGLARLYSSDLNAISTGLSGTLGYMAPEYIACGQLTEKVDVYSYGILVLEIISGVQNSKFKPDESIETLVTSTWKHFQLNTVSEIVDESMEVDEIEEIVRVVRVGLLCTQEVPSLRPTMTEIIQMLRQKDLCLPTPSKPPFVDEFLEISPCLHSSLHSWKSSHNIDH